MNRLRYGMVGGGLGSFIGETHWHASQISNLSDLVAGCFSRKKEVSLKTAEKWNLPDPDRIYGDWKEMAEAEAAREDGIDFVVVATPNSSHYDVAKCFLEHGIHVLSDKPMTRDVEEAEELCRIAAEKNLFYGLTYGYTGYPAIRQAREMIRSGAVGKILYVRVCHPEDWVAETDFSGIESGEAQVPWRFRPEIAGQSLCTADLGSHAEQMLVQFTGLHVRRVLAMFDTYPDVLPLETNVTALLQLDEGVTGELWASQIAEGKLCDPEIYVVGTKGALEWKHSEADILRFTEKGKGTLLLHAGRDYMTRESNRLMYVAAGHHSGFLEGFASIYQSFCETLLAAREGRDADGWIFPSGEDGLACMRFIRACVESNRAGNVWVDL